MRAAYSVQVLYSRHHTHSHLSSLSRRLGTRVQGGSESLTNLLHSRLQLLSLEEYDEHTLEHLVSLKEIEN